MKKLKVMTVVGTRPEIIRLSAVINKLDESEAIVHILVHTGQCLLCIFYNSHDISL
jgi:UDP-N-acetylglucosamine 2-epimerase (non-hydrolysing)